MSRSQRTLFVVLVLALIAVIAISVLDKDKDEDGAPAPAPAAATAGAEPHLLTPAQLADFATASGGATYWVGPRPGARYELTASVGGPTYVRYLRGNARVGDPRPNFLTVATYPEPNGAAALRQLAREEPAAELSRIADGALLLTRPSSPDSAYLAYPDTDVQIELFSPVPNQARGLAAGGEVRRIP